MGVEARDPRRSTTRFEDYSIGHLRALIGGMYWRIYSSAKAEKERPSKRAVRLNEAFMIATAVLAERTGDVLEGMRLRETWGGFKERFRVSVLGK